MSTPSQQIQKCVSDATSKNATSIAQIYTTDAVLCATEGIIKGQNNIKSDFEKQFKAGWTLTNIANEVDNVKADWGWSYGSWSGTFPNPKPPHANVPVQGSWSIVWVLHNGNWLIQQQTIVTNLP
jgi:ketosteroid isomerase-like protein